MRQGIFGRSKARSDDTSSSSSSDADEEILDESTNNEEIDYDKLPFLEIDSIGPLGTMNIFLNTKMVIHEMNLQTNNS